MKKKKSIVHQFDTNNILFDIAPTQNINISHIIEYQPVNIQNSDNSPFDLTESEEDLDNIAQHLI